MLDALERADVDAELAAGAELLDDLGLRDLLRLDARDEVAVLVLDGVDRAVDAADGAVDAALGVDVVLPLGRAPDRVRGALDLADAAPDAFVSDEMRHALGSESLPDARDHRTSVEAERLDAMLLADEWRARALARSPIQTNGAGGIGVR